jgi:hypothetical protein
MNARIAVRTAIRSLVQAEIGHQFAYTVAWRAANHGMRSARDAWEDTPAERDRADAAHADVCAAHSVVRTTRGVGAQLLGLMTCERPAVRLAALVACRVSP